MLMNFLFKSCENMIYIHLELCHSTLCSACRSTGSLAGISLNEKHGYYLVTENFMIRFYSIAGIRIATGYISPNAIGRLNGHPRAS